jgi:hypothetical protein
MPADSPYPELPTVADVARDVRRVARQLSSGRLQPFAFGDNGVPEAVIASYDQYDDLGGDTSLGHYPTVLALEAVGRQLGEMVEAIRRGTSGSPVLCGDGPEPQFVVMSPDQYRTMRGDDTPPPGVLDDPTVRDYATEPLAGSQPFDLDEWAKDDPFTQEILADIRRDDTDGRASSRSTALRAADRPTGRRRRMPRPTGWSSSGPRPSSGCRAGATRSGPPR